ncbi:MAG: metal-dependent hydrolase [Bacteroidota bacterium]
MDSVTHIVLGACIGEAIAGKQLGKKAMLLGAIAQSIPDIDFVASFWMNTTNDLLAHRGFTHSILCTLLLTPLLAYLSQRYSKTSSLLFPKWMLFWGLQITIHIFIDAFNAYGTGWFEPFSHYRVSFNSVYVADPLFSIWPAIACVALLVLNKLDIRRKKWAMMGMVLSSAYLVAGIFNKLLVEKDVKVSLSKQHITYSSYFTTPTPLNNLLWFVVAESDSGYYTGYRAVLDSKPIMQWRYVRRNEALFASIPDRSEARIDLENLKRFAQGYYTAEKRHDTLVFNNLRFGETAGWASTEPHFAFYYYLQYPDANKLIVQRGRFAGWDQQVVRSLFTRIKGN